MKYLLYLFPLLVLCSCNDTSETSGETITQEALPPSEMRTLYYHHGPDDAKVSIYVELNPPSSHLETKSPEERTFEIDEETAAAIFAQFDQLSGISQYRYEEGVPRLPWKSHLLWLYEHASKTTTKYAIPKGEVEEVRGLAEFLAMLEETAAGEGS